MASKITEGTTNGHGRRKLPSWIQSFIEQTENLNCPRIFRQWAAISTISAVLEQKVWVKTASRLHPNLYVFIIGHPGVGKTRTVRESRKIVQEVPEFHLSPISMTWAALTDALTMATRTITRAGEDPIFYNSMYICADELGAFIHKYDNEMIDGLSALYDPDPYTQVRRTNDIKIKIESPQLNILCGSTPQNLTMLMPDKAWGQGFSSRLIMVFSDERIIGDDFALQPAQIGDDLRHDLSIINGLIGEFVVTKEFADKVLAWRKLGSPPVPSHPKLIHYITRRHVHLYKLSMVAAVDRSNNLSLTAADFDTAFNWLIEAELTMPEIFKAGATNADGQAMDEIRHFMIINDSDKGVPEHKIINFARERIPITSILRIVEIMEKSGLIRCIRVERSGRKFYRAIQPDAVDPLAALQ